MLAAAARQSEKGKQRPRSRPEWLIAAFVSLVAATVYLCISINQAVHGHGDDRTAIAVVPALGGPAVTRVATIAAQPPSESVERPAVAPAPIPGLAAPVGDPVLLKAVEDAIDEDQDHIAVSVRRISDGKAASVNGDYQFYAASTFKLAILYEAELRHFRGDLEYTDTLFISDEDAAEDLGTSGYLEFEPDGSITVANLLEAMITVSDNSSAVALLHAFGGGAIDQTLRDLGLKTMTVNSVELWTTADDLARLMEAIYVGEGLGPEERAQMRDLLLRQTVRIGIPASIQAEFGARIPIGNKTGTWPGAQHDVAFVEDQSGAYVIAVLTDGSYEGWLELDRVVRAVHRTFSLGR